MSSTTMNDASELSASTHRCAGAAAMACWPSPSVHSSCP
jgi:hypothetical protein